jgi:GT2 family glycosyltransferase
MLKKKLAVVVLMWNDWRNTEECLNSLLKQNYNNFQIVLVDNNSDSKFLKELYKWKKNFFFDELKTYQETSKKKIIFIKNKINLGCGYGHNIGYGYSITNNFKYTARIDNDMVAPPYLIRNLIKILDSNERIVGISPKIMFYDKKKLIWWKGTKIGHSLKFQKHMRNYKYGEVDSSHIRNNLIETDSIAGCASIMRTERLKLVGLSDRDFFYGPEDVELSFRLKLEDNSLLVSLNNKIYHKVTQSFRNLSKQRMYYEYKYRLVLISKIGTFGDKLFGYAVSLLKWFLYCFFFMSKKHRFKIIPVAFAIFDFYLGNLGDFDRKKKRFN